MVIKAPKDLQVLHHRRPWYRYLLYRLLKRAKQTLNASVLPWRGNVGSAVLNAHPEQAKSKGE